MFAAQITKDGQVLPLSDYDRETLRNIQKKFEDFADKVLNMPTPTTYVKKSKGLIIDARAIAFIIEKIVLEKDSKVYPLWISKYGEYAFDIIANRYAN